MWKLAAVAAQAQATPNSLLPYYYNTNFPMQEGANIYIYIYINNNFNKHICNTFRPRTINNTKCTQNNTGYKRENNKWPLTKKISYNRTLQPGLAWGVDEASRRNFKPGPRHNLDTSTRRHSQQQSEVHSWFPACFASVRDGGGNKK
jgi:hypothetical protein